MVKLVYTGSIYRQEHPEILFEAMARGPINNIEVHLYGRGLDWVMRLADEWKVADRVFYHGFIPKKQVKEVQLEADALLVFKWYARVNTGGWPFAILSLITGDIDSFRWVMDNRNKYEAVTPGKVYDYIPTGIPIISIGGIKDEVSEIVEGDYHGIDLCTVDEIIDFFSPPALV